MRKKIGHLLLELGYVTKAQIEEALALQETEHSRQLGKILVQLGYLTKEQVSEALSKKLNMPIMSCAHCEIGGDLKNLVPRDLAIKRLVFPVEKKGDTLMLAMADPLDYRTMDDLSFRTKLRIQPMLSYETSITEAIARNYEEGVNGFESFTAEVGSDKEIQFIEDARRETDFSHHNVDDLYTQSQAPTVIRLVATIITEAVKARASDVHIEPQQNHILVRFRTDGELRTIFRYKKNLHESVISRIKIISNLDITNRRLPQGGSLRVSFKRKEIDLRVSTLPAVHGEKIVIRVLDQSLGIIPLEELGFPEHILDAITEIFRSPQGMFLVTGPTGSGKTTTLYACINQLRSDTRNIITIEDPVEYKLDGITQVQVDESIGRTFATILREVLRQDPDVIKVGEVRDLETAEIAIRAGLTGHLVLSTLHTNNTFATVTRLVDIGIPPYLLGSAVSGILAQRLVRKICYNCKTESEVPEHLQRVVERYDLPALRKSYHGRGCHICYNTGYSGRLAVYEFLPVTRTIRNLISRHASEDELTSAAREEGVALLFEDAWHKVIAGLTTVEEVVAKVPAYTMLVNVSASV
ncbi:MAG: GspE/PulE family protein [Chloroflexota bacterium]